MVERPEPLTLIREANKMGLGATLLGGIGGIFLAIQSGIIRYVQALAAFFVEPLLSFAEGLAAFVQAMIMGQVDIINQGVRTSVFFLAPGSDWVIGPFTVGIAFLVIGLELYVLARILQAPFTSDLVPFSFTDFPGIGWILDPGADEEESDLND
jgi:hypothetical protein